MIQRPKGYIFKTMNRKYFIDLLQSKSFILTKEKLLETCSKDSVQLTVEELADFINLSLYVTKN